MSTNVAALPQGRLLYPESEAREQLGGISRSTLYVLFRTGALKPTKVGRRVFVSAAELDRYVATLPGGER